VFKYSDPALDTLLDSARTETDTAKRKASYDKVQTMLACQGPAAFISYSQLYTAMRANVTGFEILANRSLASLANTSIAK
jgi:peptide/nickel transport system substrate-binding protein